MSGFVFTVDKCPYFCPLSKNVRICVHTLLCIDSLIKTGGRRPLLNASFIKIDYAISCFREIYLHTFEVHK